MTKLEDNYWKRLCDKEQENKVLKEEITWWSNRFKAVERDNRQLKELCDRYEEEHNKEFKIWLQEQKVLAELEEWLKNKIDNFGDGVRDTILHEQMTISIIYDYIQELKEKYK